MQKQWVGISIGKNNLTDSSNDGRNAANTRDENSQIAIGRDNVANSPRYDCYRS